MGDRKCIKRFSALETDHSIARKGILDMELETTNTKSIPPTQKILVIDDDI